MRWGWTAAGLAAALSVVLVLPAAGAAPKWKLVQGGEVIFSVRGNYVSGHAEVRLMGVKLPPLSTNKREDSQPGGFFWLLGRHDPRRIDLLYRGQTLRATQSLRIDEVEPAIQYHFYFTPKGAAKAVFSKLGRGTGTMTFATAAGNVRMQAPVRIKPYG
jgi:hypothetical protein